MNVLIKNDKEYYHKSCLLSHIMLTYLNEHDIDWVIGDDKKIHPVEDEQADSMQRGTLPKGF